MCVCVFLPILKMFSSIWFWDFSFAFFLSSCMIRGWPRPNCSQTKHKRYISAGSPFNRSIVSSFNKNKFTSKIEMDKLKMDRCGPGHTASSPHLLDCYAIDSILLSHNFFSSPFLSHVCLCLCVWSQQTFHMFAQHSFNLTFQLKFLFISINFLVAHYQNLVSYPMRIH